MAGVVVVETGEGWLVKVMWNEWRLLLGLPRRGWVGLAGAHRRQALWFRDQI